MNPSKKVKRFLAVALMAGCVAVSSRAGYDPKLIYVLEQLRHCRLAQNDSTPMVGGRAVGFAGAPHEFYLLFPYIRSLAHEDDLVAMLHDQSPVVRIMGAKCVLSGPWPPGSSRPNIDFLLEDRTLVFFADVGCMITKRTVGDIVSDLKKSPDLLGDLKEPNQPSKTQDGGSSP